MDHLKKTLSLEGFPTLPTPRIGRDEMNLCEFPFATLTCRNKGKKTLIFSDTIRSQDGKIIERTWTVTGSDQWGLPTPIEEHLYIALMEITREHDFASRRVPITRYELINRLRWPQDGRSYQRLTESLKRLQGVSIYADQAFWDKQAKSYVTLGLGILDSFVLHSEAPGRKAEGSALPQSWILWNEFIFQSMQQGNIKYLDTDFYFTLDHYIAQRLYRYLDKKRYDGKRHYTINLFDLAFCHLGLDRPTNPYPSLVKQRLQPAHEELLDRKFLTQVVYCTGRDGEMVEYHFEPNRKRTPSLPAVPPVGGPRSPAPCSEEERELIEALTTVGITRTVAQRLTQDHPASDIRQQLDYLPHRQAEDPAALLVKAIQENWAAPKAYQQAQEAAAKQRQQEAAARQQAEQEAAAEQARQERQERLEDFKAALSPEELERLFEEALQRWAPGTQQWHRERGIAAPASQALLDQWIAQKYLGEKDDGAAG